MAVPLRESNEVTLRIDHDLLNKPGALLKQATQAQALAANPTPLITAAGIYLLMLLPLVRLVGLLEARWAAQRR